MPKNSKEQLSFSELASLMIEHIPSEMAEILAVLTLTEKSLKIPDIVQVVKVSYIVTKVVMCHITLILFVL